MPENKGLFEIIGAALVVGFFSVVAIFMGRKKSKADTSKSDAETKLITMNATEKELAFYKTLLSDFKDEVEKLRTSVINFRAENEKLHNEVERVKAQNKEFKKQIDELIGENQILLNQLKNTAHE